MMLPFIMAVTVVVPEPTAVTLPSVSTVATFVSAEFHETVLPSLLFFTLIFLVLPAFLKLIFLTDSLGRVTFTLILSFICVSPSASSPKYAVIVALPDFFASISPSSVTVATEVLELFQDEGATVESMNSFPSTTS